MKKLVVVLQCSILAMFVSVVCPPRAQSQLPTGSVSGVTPQSCPTGLGFYTTDPTYPMACTSINISCPNTVQIGMTYGVLNPGGANGTVVFFTGGGGEEAAEFPGEEQSYAQIYVGQGYQVVQTSWNSDWENTNNAGNGPEAYNIRNAACRIATFLS